MTRLPGILSSVVVFSALCACTGSKPADAKGTDGIATPLSSADGSTAAIAQGKWPWPCWRGVNGTGISPMTGFNKDWTSKPPRLLWQAPLSDNGWSGPASDGKILYIVDHSGGDDIVHAWDLATGKEVWQTKYADADNDNQGFTRTTPAIDGNNLYTVSRLGKVICFDTKNGSIKWKHDFVSEYGGQRPTWDYSVSPIVDGNKLILAPGAEDGAIVVLDKKTGALLSKAGTGAASYATPVIATIQGVRQYVLFQAKKLAGISTDSGKELWSVPWQTGPDVNAATPVVIGNSVFIASGYGHGCGLVDVDKDGAKIRWQNRVIQAHFNAPILYKGYIYGTGDPGKLTCLDPNTGTAVWQKEGFEKGGMCAAEGLAFVNNGSNGDVVLVKLDPSGYTEVGRIAPIRGRAWSSPILVDGKLVVRTIDKIAVVDIS
ncbi:MAG: PQQ-binding-like beta-propeller repeat protein [Fimbriimonas sp.]|nr:PQQ-binding-like beta-propeller repeat protein [Fimbriimonas sp.]